MIRVVEFDNNKILPAVCSIAKRARRRPPSSTLVFTIAAPY